MRTKSFFRILLLTFILFLFLLFSWWAISGAVRQIPLADTFGQQAETVFQVGFGILSFLTVATTFWCRYWAKPIRTAWLIFFATTAGLSALVWGPPMPFIALIFTFGAIMIGWGMIWALRRLANNFKSKPVINSD